jgi:hypothetical protein
MEVMVMDTTREVRKAEIVIHLLIPEIDMNCSLFTPSFLMN